MLGLLFFAVNLTLRSRAIFNSLRAAYPDTRFQWRRIWGAYFAAVGLDNVVPARGGDVVKVFLAKSSIPDSSYATIAAAIYTEAPFDVLIGTLVLVFAFTQGVFPKPPAFASSNAFDLSFLASNVHLTLFLITFLAVATLFLFAVLSRRVLAFWERVRQGFTIMRDRERYLREVIALQAAAWLFRAAGFWLFLDAFRVGGSVRNVMLVFGVNAVAGAIPLTPGGAGVQQALLVKVFASSGKGGIVAAYSVGQQIAIAAMTSETVAPDAAMRCGSIEATSAGVTAPWAVAFEMPGTCARRGTTVLVMIALKSFGESVADDANTVTTVDSLGSSDDTVGVCMSVGNL